MLLHSTIQVFRLHLKLANLVKCIILRWDKSKNCITVTKFSTKCSLSYVAFFISQAWFISYGIFLVVNCLRLRRSNLVTLTEALVASFYSFGYFGATFISGFIGLKATQVVQFLESLLGFETLYCTAEPSKYILDIMWFNYYTTQYTGTFKKIQLKLQEKVHWSIYLQNSLRYFLFR